MLETVGFQNRIRVGNRIQFSTRSQYRDPQLLAALSTDRPVVGVLNTGMVFGMERASNASFITPQYQIVLVCGDPRLDVEFYPCLWEIVGAVLGWWDNLRKLLYRGEIFIHMAEPTSLSSVYVDPTENKGIKGWVGRLTYEVQMNFQTTAIRSN
jgi:hypothetical protein